MRTSRRVYFENADGIRLSGIIEQPDAPPVACAIFSHCFTCTKDLKAIVKISRRLAEHGVAVLRFDFTGLGNSEGNFSDSNFDSNCADVRAAIEFMGQEIAPPKLLVGHSLGGTAMLTVVAEFDSVQAITTIASPSTTLHLSEFLERTNPGIVEDGSGEVEIGGRTYLIKNQLLENLRAHDLSQHLAKLTIPHLVIHPKNDQTLPYWHAEKMLAMTGGPGSLITLEEADHLLVKPAGEAEYVADLINLWFSRTSG